MTAMNVVHMRVKPGKEDEYIRIHKEMDLRAMPGGRNFWLIRSGERSFIVVAEWDSLEALAAARPAMIGNLDNWQALLPLLEKLPNVAGVSPMVSGAGLALRGEAVQAIALMGVDLDRYDRVVGLRSKVVSGTARLEPGESILGRELAQDLGVRVGDRLTVQTGQRSESLRVTALVDLGVKDLNRRTVIVPLRAAQNLLALPGGATSLDLTLNDVWVAQTMARDLRAQFPYKIESWQESNAQLVSALNAQSVSTSIIRGVVLAVVVLGIASVLVVSVVQKQREIGILRAMGATRGQVMRLFLVQGAVVGAVGSALGILLAVVLMEKAGPIEHRLRQRRPRLGRRIGLARQRHRRRRHRRVQRVGNPGIVVGAGDVGVRRISRSRGGPDQVLSALAARTGIGQRGAGVEQHRSWQPRRESAQTDRACAKQRAHNGFSSCHVHRRPPYRPIEMMVGDMHASVKVDLSASVAVMPAVLLALA